jgi:hypothetical protein
MPRPKRPGANASRINATKSLAPKKELDVLQREDEKPRLIFPTAKRVRTRVKETKEKDEKIAANRQEIAQLKHGLTTSKMNYAKPAATPAGLVRNNLQKSAGVLSRALSHVGISLYPERIDLSIRR